jgi:Protein of unknown function (DUF1688)
MSPRILQPNVTTTAAAITATTATAAVQQKAGIKLTECELMTGLPEYRNGGLMIDMGLLQPKYPEVVRFILQLLALALACTCCLSRALASGYSSRVTNASATAVATLRAAA